MELSLEKPRLQGRKFSKHVRLWLAVVGLIMAGIAGLLFSSIALLLKSEGWVSHSYQILDTLDLTEAYFSDAQSAERGYAATCKPALLSPFNRDLPQIFANVASLRHLTTDNPAQQERALALSEAISAELERMSRVITTTTAGRQLEAEAMLARPDEASADRSIGNLIDAMQADERTLLSVRMRNVTLFAWTMLVSSAVGVLLIGGILILVLRLVRRETARREGTETSLQESHARLSDSLEELRKYNASARAISLLGELLQTCQSLEEAVSIAARHLQEMFPGTAIAIALFNQARDGMDVVRSLGDGALFAPHFRAADCWALRRGRSHGAGSRGFEPNCSHVEGPGQYTFCVPLAAQGDTLGVLTLCGDVAPGEFERQTVQTVAEQLSLALANLKLQETLRHQSFRDPLTGLFNRRYMDDAMQREITRAGRHEVPLAMRGATPCWAPLDACSRAMPAATILSAVMAGRNSPSSCPAPTCARRQRGSRKSALRRRRCKPSPTASPSDPSPCRPALRSIRATAQPAAWCWRRRTRPFMRPSMAGATAWCAPRRPPCRRPRKSAAPERRSALRSR
jgi:CHASE3 domain sensor protein